MPGVGGSSPLIRPNPATFDPTGNFSKVAGSFKALFILKILFFKLYVFVAK